MTALLALSRAIDLVNTTIGRAVAFLVLADVLISAGNAVSRYLFSASSNAWLEIQWYLFSAMFLLGAAYALKANEHVRVDIIYGALSERRQFWIDLLGAIFFLLPVTLGLAYMSWWVFVSSWEINESSSNAGGLVRWPVKLLMPIGFLLLSIQGVSEIIKRLAALTGATEIHIAYEKPLQ